ncbi:MAG: hypothetical protein FWH05_00970 [Oscillospiraceae bacterium]|nr:hypothetical protein [Oscillospiraceae bacterium]
MNVKNLNNSVINTYKNIGNTKVLKEKKENVAKASADNFDKVEFNFDLALKAAKTDITTALSKSVNAERLNALAAAYAGDNCPVGAAETAGAILK